MRIKDEDVIGKRFGRLVALSVYHAKNYRYVKCQCDCGNEKAIRIDHLIKGRTKSCGCLITNISVERKHKHSGEKYGRLTVLHRSERKTESGVRYYVCRCECGNIKESTISHLTSGDTRSCGCLQDESRRNTITHGCDRKNKPTRLYVVWAGMNARCKDKCNLLYGGRNISVCEEWKNDFSAFMNWATLNSYGKSLTIDRIDNDKGYSPENCRWATPKEQSRNKRNSRILSYKGVSQTVADWADEVEESGAMQGKTFKSRIDRGWNVEDAIEIPLKKYTTKCNF